MSDLVLRRIAYRPDGIFSVLLLDGAPRFVTLEHAYQNPSGWQPIIPAGEYQCQRGTHQLTSSGPFETYEVTGVAGHTGLLFHWGNANKDSEGCVLVGMQFGLYASAQVLVSRPAFLNFMDWASARQSLSLSVFA